MHGHIFCSDLAWENQNLDRTVLCVKGTERVDMSLANDTSEMQDHTDEFYTEQNDKRPFYFLFSTYIVST